MTIDFRLRLMPAATFAALAILATHASAEDAWGEDAGTEVQPPSQITNLGKLTVEKDVTVELKTPEDGETLLLPSYSTLTFEKGGILDLTKMKFPPNIYDDSNKEVFTFLDRGESIRIENLKGDVGVFHMKLNRDTLFSEVIRITGSSEGTHILRFEDKGNGEVPDCAILVVKSKAAEGDGTVMHMMRSAPPGGPVPVNPDEVKPTEGDFKAKFCTDTPVEIGATKLFVMNWEEVEKKGLEANFPDDYTANDWFLAPAEKSPIEVPIHPGGNEDKEVPANDTAMGEIGSVTINHLSAVNGIDTLRRRLGDARRVVRVDADPAPWVRIAGGRTKAAGKTLSAGLKYDEAVVELGIDTQVGDGAVAGVFADYVHGDGSMHHGQDVKNHGGRVGLYYTRLLPNDAYVDLVARAGWNNTRVKGLTSSGKRFEVKGIKGVYGNVSAEAGRSFDLGSGWSVEPALTATYTRIGTVSMTATTGLNARMKSHSSFITHAGALLEKRLGDPEAGGTSAYLKAAWEREWIEAPDVVFSGTDTAHPKWRGNAFVYGFGVEGSLQGRHAWHLALERSTGCAFEREFRVDLGMRFAF